MPVGQALHAEDLQRLREPLEKWKEPGKKMLRRGVCLCTSRQGAVAAPIAYPFLTPSSRASSLRRRAALLLWRRPRWRRRCGSPRCRLIRSPTLSERAVPHLGRGSTHPTRASRDHTLVLTFRGRSIRGSERSFVRDVDAALRGWSQLGIRVLCFIRLLGGWCVGRLAQRGCPVPSVRRDDPHCDVPAHHGHHFRSVALHPLPMVIGTQALVRLPVSALSVLRAPNRIDPAHEPTLAAARLSRPSHQPLSKPCSSTILVWWVSSQLRGLREPAATIWPWPIRRSERFVRAL